MSGGEQGNLGPYLKKIQSVDLGHARRALQRKLPENATALVFLKNAWPLMQLLEQVAEN
jgi:hypothetical protein